MFVCYCVLSCEWCSLFGKFSRFGKFLRHTRTPDISPNRIIPMMLNKVAYPALQSIMEVVILDSICSTCYCPLKRDNNNYCKQSQSHQLISAVEALALFAYPMLNSRIFKAGPRHLVIIVQFVFVLVLALVLVFVVFPCAFVLLITYFQSRLLKLTLPGIDVNDNVKTRATLYFYTGLFDIN